MKETEIEQLLHDALGRKLPDRNVLTRAEAEMDAELARTKKRVTAKPKSAFGRLFLSSKRGIAAFAACMILFTAVAVAIPVVWLSGGLDMMRTLNLLKNTKVDMTGVEAFGIMEVGSGDGAQTGMALKRSMSIHRTSDGESDYEDWESDYDWDPTKAQLLVKIDEDGAVEEVVYERTNGRGQVRQDKLGHVVGIRNKAFDINRNDRKHRACNIDDCHDIRSVVDFEEKATTDAALDSALDGLDQIERTALYYKFWEGLTVREIAKALALPRSTAQNTISTALRKLGEYLKDSHKKDSHK